MISLAFHILSRRPVRSLLITLSLALALAVLGCLSTFGERYRGFLMAELDRMGMQMMLVPLGCPYDAAARVLKGHTLDNSLPEAAARAAAHDPDVAIAAPLLMAAIPRPEQGRTDLWVGIDRQALGLKPWWRAHSGASWFPDSRSVILGSEAAAVELREVGDFLYSPETGVKLRVAGILERSGTSDDSLFFVPLSTAQQMFHQPGRLTAVGIRLKDPDRLESAVTRLQKTPGAQVVTLTEMMGVFLSLVGAVRSLLVSFALVALVTGVLGVFNTLFGLVIEQTPNLALMRALGASRSQIFILVALQGLLLTGLAAALAVAAAAWSGRLFDGALSSLVPLAPPHGLVALTARTFLVCISAGIGSGLAGALYPAWYAARILPALAGRPR